MSEKLIYPFFVPDWSDEAVSSAEILRLIYQGRFLHGNVTLAALGLPTGKTTVMHLVPRESLPEPNSQGKFGEILRLRHAWKTYDNGRGRTVTFHT